MSNSNDVFPVVPICEKQRKDVNPDDILNQGKYRKCNIYKAGGGYDLFPEIYQKRFRKLPENIGNQFVVQLLGCPLKCPYCYVTQDGVNGKPIMTSAKELVDDFLASGCGVFHLMGGAPALYIEKWHNIIEKLPVEIPFHSDFVLCEKEYDQKVLDRLAAYGERGLYAVSVKGNRNFYENQNVSFELVKRNMYKLLESGLNYYFTFTGMTDAEIETWKNMFSEHDYSDSLNIKIIDYEALK